MAASYVIKGTRYTIATAAAAGVVAALDGRSLTEGLKRVVMEETLSPAAVETPMSNPVPAGSVIVAVLGNAQAALTGGGTTATWSLGITGDVDKYGTAGYPTVGDSLAKNSKSSWIGATQLTTAAETIKLCAAATGGAAAGDTALTVGSVRVVVIYDTYEALDDAA